MTFPSVKTHLVLSKFHEIVTWEVDHWKKIEYAYKCAVLNPDFTILNINLFGITLFKYKWAYFYVFLRYLYITGQ